MQYRNNMFLQHSFASVCEREQTGEVMTRYKLHVENTVFMICKPHLFYVFCLVILNATNYIDKW